MVIVSSLSSTHICCAAYTLSSGNNRLRFMARIISFAQAYPKTYLTGCLALGTLIRLSMAHGDWGLFMDPLYPLIHR